MTIRERNGRYQAIVKFKGRQVAVKTFGSHSEAKAWHDVVAARYRGSRFSGTLGRLDVAAVMEEFLRYRATQIAESSLATDEVVIRLVKPHLKGTRIMNLQSQDLQLLIDKWSRGRKVSTVSRYADTLKAFTAFCVRRGYVVKDLMGSVDVPKRQKVPRELRPFTEQEIEDVAATVGGFYGDVILVLGFSGLRFGEARAIRVGDVILDAKYPFFNVIRSQAERMSEKSTKSNRRRSVPVDPRLTDVIERLSVNKKRNGYLLSRDGRSQVWRSSFIRATNWDEVGQGRTLHDFRHAAAVNWLRRGIAANTVQAWLGHSDLAATNIYTSYLGMDIDAGAYAMLGGVTDG